MDAVQAVGNGLPCAELSGDGSRLVGEVLGEYEVFRAYGSFGLADEAFGGVVLVPRIRVQPTVIDVSELVARTIQCGAHVPLELAFRRRRRGLERRRITRRFLGGLRWLGRRLGLRRLRLRLLDGPRR